MINKKQAQAFIKAIKDLRDSVSNEQAQAVAILYPTWREDTTYDKGERLQYNDKLYIVNEIHKSSVDNSPEVNNNLYTEI